MLKKINIKKGVLVMSSLSEEEKQIFERVKKIVAKKLNCEEQKVQIDSNFVDLGADSLDSVELLMSLEDEFGIEIPDDQAETISKVGEIVSLIHQSKKARE